MSKSVTIMLSAEDSGQRRELTGALSQVGGVETVFDFGGKVDSAPDLIVVADSGGETSLVEHLSFLRRRVADVPVLVVSNNNRPEHIVEVMTAGAVDFILMPASVDRLREAIGRVMLKADKSSKGAQGKVYSLISSKGGLGATVLAVNIATKLAMKAPGEVLLVDNSLEQGDASVLLDIVPKQTISHLCRNLHRLDRIYLQSSAVEHSTGLHLLAAPIEPEETEFVKADHMESILGLARTLYENIIVDCGSMSLEPCTRTALVSSERVFVVTDLSMPAVRNTARLIQRMHKLNIDPHRIEVVVNRYIRGAVLSVGEIEKTLRRRIYWLFPNDFDGIVSSINEGVPMVDKHAGSPFSKSVGEFCSKLGIPSESEGYRGARGLFGKAI